METEPLTYDVFIKLGFDKDLTYDEYLKQFESANT